MSHHLPEGATGPARYPHNVNIAFAGLGGLGCGCTAPSVGGMGRVEVPLTRSSELGRRVLDGSRFNPPYSLSGGLGRVVIENIPGESAWARRARVERLIREHNRWHASGMSGLGADEVEALEQQILQYEGEVQADRERKRLFPYFAAFLVGCAVGRAWR